MNFVTQLTLQLEVFNKNRVDFFSLTVFFVTLQRYLGGSHNILGDPCTLGYPNSSIHMGMNDGVERAVRPQAEPA